MKLGDLPTRVTKKRAPTPLEVLECHKFYPTEIRHIKFLLVTTFLVNLCEMSASWDLTCKQNICMFFLRLSNMLNRCALWYWSLVWFEIEDHLGKKKEISADESDFG